MTKKTKIDVIAMPRESDRITYAFIEHARICIDDGSIKVLRDEGSFLIPATSISCLMLGPGTTVTHDAMKLLCASGTSTLWVGSDQTRYYGYATPLTSTAKYAIAQASISSNAQKRLLCAKEMYRKRFADTDEFDTADNLRKLRALEGQRVKKIYAENAKRTGVKWYRRNYTHNDYESGDQINKLLTTGATILYAVETAIINSLGMSTALGIIHTGNIDSFVFDMSDLYKFDIMVPLAFDIASEKLDDDREAESMMRQRLRERMYKGKILKRSICDIGELFGLQELLQVDFVDLSNYENSLWNENGNSTIGGRNYSA